MASLRFLRFWCWDVGTSRRHFVRASARIFGFPRKNIAPAPGIPRNFYLPLRLFCRHSCCMRRYTGYVLHNAIPHLYLCPALASHARVAACRIAPMALLHVWVCSAGKATEYRRKIRCPVRWSTRLDAVPSTERLQQAYRSGARPSHLRPSVRRHY